MEESNVTFLFLGGKNPLGRYSSPHLSIWLGSVQGPGCKILPVHTPTEVLRNTEVTYSSEWISKWKMEMWGRMEEESVL